MKRIIPTLISEIKLTYTRQLILFVIGLLFYSLTYSQKDPFVGGYRGVFECYDTNIELILEVKKVSSLYEGVIKVYVPKTKRSKLIGLWKMEGHLNTLFGEVTFSSTEQNIYLPEIANYKFSKVKIKPPRYNFSKIDMLFDYGGTCKWGLKRNAKISRAVRMSQENEVEKDKIAFAKSGFAGENSKNFEGYWYGETYIDRASTQVQLYASEETSWVRVTQPNQNKIHYLHVTNAKHDEIIFADDGNLKLKVYRKPYNGRFYTQMEFLEGAYTTFKNNRKISLNKSNNTAGAGNTGTAPYKYADWQAKAGNGALFMNDGSKVRLEQTIDKLYTKGRWKCLTQTTIWVRSGKQYTLDLNSKIPRSLNLIYAPTGNNKITYKVRGFGKVNTSGYDYPVFYSTSPTNSSFVVSFDIERNPFNPELSEEKIPVTVFSFGNSFGDYGDGCEYYAKGQVQTYILQRNIISYILFVYLAESGRKLSAEHKDEFSETSFENGRDFLIKEILKSAFPMSGESDLDLYVFLTSILIEKDYSLKGLTKAGTKFMLSQKSKEFTRNSNYNLNDVVADFLIDLLVNKTYQYGGKGIN